MVPEEIIKDETRTRLLDAAQTCFAAAGLKGASLRDITARARANLAAVNYHFGSKEKLFDAVFERGIGELNGQRLRMLDQAEAQANGQPPALESVLHAFIAPAIRMCRQKPEFMMLCARIQAEPNLGFATRFVHHFAEIAARMESLLTRILPQVSNEELWWRMHFLIGSMIRVWTSSEQVSAMTRGRYRFDDEERMIRMLVAFGAAGLSALPSEGQPRSKPAHKAKATRTSKPSRQSTYSRRTGAKKK